MKKIYLTFIAIAFAIEFSYAQTTWTTGGSDIYNTNTGNVGIGTPAPSSILELSTSAAGMLGASLATITLRNTSSTIGSTIGISFKGPNATSTGIFAGMYGVTTGGSASGQIGAIVFGTKGLVGDAVLTERMRIDNNGNVGIGTTTPDQALTVNGTTHTKEVLVDLSIYPDYVFKPTYHLPTLTEVKTYIDQNHHLPDMPTEAEVAKDGLKVGETEALLTKKVEELTLYLIKQKEETDSEISKLKHQISNLKHHRK